MQLKNQYLSLIVILLMAFTIPQLFAQTPLRWVHPQPAGSFLNAVYYGSNGTFFAVGDQGTVLKKETGEDWQVIFMLGGKGNRFLDVHFVSDQIGFMVGNNQYVKGMLYKTVDGGQSWGQQIKSEDVAFNKVFFLNEQKGWLCARGGKLFTTEDGGENWQTLAFDENWSFSEIAFMDADTGITVINGNEMYRTTNGGLNWHFLLNFTVNSVHFVPQTGGKVVWAGGWRGGLIKSEDWGKTWQEVPLGIENSITKIQFVNDTLGWLAGENGLIMVTKDGGQTWEQQNTGTIEYISDLQFKDGNNGVAVGWFGLLLKTVNGGQDWQILGTRKTNSSLYFILFGPKHSLWVTGPDGVIITSSDNGKNWERIKDIPGATIYNIAFLTPDTAWLVGGFNYGSSLVMRSVDGGNTWEWLQSPHSNYRFYDIRFRNTLEGWIAEGQGKLHHTLDGGDTWEVVETGIEGYIKQIELLGENTIVLRGCEEKWSKCETSYLLVSHDNGLTWTTHTHRYSDISMMTFVDDQHGWALSNRSTILRTTDGGDTWNIVNNELNEAIKILFTDTLHGYYFNNLSLYETKDGGASWQLYSDLVFPYEFYPYDCALTGSDTLWFATEHGGVFQVNLSQLTSINNSKKQLPLQTVLFPNYPNPFNPSTTIEYELPMSGFVRLTVYNLLGQKVRTLVNTRQTAGLHRIVWDGCDESGLPVSSGVYFYQLRTDAKTQTQKMMLLR